ncbi:MAG: polyprenyl synthetase family protein [Myxococcota bacterium]
MSLLEEAPHRVQTALTEALDRIRPQIAEDGPPDGHRVPDRLFKAMKYAVLSPGKRLRPTLVLSAAHAVGGRIDDALPAACAVEMIHAYSLVHDDLPSMDDDDERRGQPSCHRAFDEATALLAGDALLTEAFSILTDPRPLADGRPVAAEQRAAGVQWLARAAGAAGMVGGQQDDVAAGEGMLDEHSLTLIHRRKTGRLIQVSSALGALFGGASPQDIARLAEYGTHVGFAFQLVDDILDGDGIAAIAGDSETRDRARMWTEKALQAVVPFGSAAEPLRVLATQMAARIE